MITGDYKDSQELLRDRFTTVNKNKQKMERNLKKKKKKKKDLNWRAGQAEGS